MSLACCCMLLKVQAYSGKEGPQGIGQVGQIIRRRGLFWIMEAMHKKHSCWYFINCVTWNFPQCSGQPKKTSIILSRKLPNLVLVAKGVPTRPPGRIIPSRSAAGASVHKPCRVACHHACRCSCRVLEIMRPGQKLIHGWGSHQRWPYTLDSDRPSTSLATDTCRPKLRASWEEHLGPTHALRISTVQDFLLERRLRDLYLQLFNGEKKNTWPVSFLNCVVTFLDFCKELLPFKTASIHISKIFLSGLDLRTFRLQDHPNGLLVALPASGSSVVDLEPYG